MLTIGLTLTIVSFLLLGVGLYYWWDRIVEICTAGIIIGIILLIISLAINNIQLNLFREIEDLRLRIENAEYKNDVYEIKRLIPEITVKNKKLKEWQNKQIKPESYEPLWYIDTIRIPIIGHNNLILKEF